MARKRKQEQIKEWLSGPDFVAFLEEEVGFVPNLHGQSVARRVYSWRHGGAVSYWRADELLISLGLHLDLVPEHVWLDKRPERRSARRFSESEKREAVAKVEAGTPVAHVAREVGISAKTMSKWRRGGNAVTRGA